MAGPYYHQHPPQFSRQHLYHFSPHFTTRVPAGNSRLPSYADLDRPNVPSFGGPIVHGPPHTLPSISHTGFSEALYDDPSSSPSSSATNAQKTTTTTLQHWPVFSDPLHNRRHVELRNLPESASLPAVMRQITGFALLSVSPLRRVAAVVSPYRTAVTHSVTLEFARGDAAAAFVRSTAAVPIELPGSSGSDGKPGVVVAEQREQASAPIPRELGEAVWTAGASRALVIEAPGAALRVPANLRFQIENCPYAPRGRGEEGGVGEAGRLLQQPPAFFEDGAIGVVFRDVRDAVVAHRAWLRSPIFRNVGVAFEREGVLPELEADGEEEEEGHPESEVEVERKGEEGESGEDGGATGTTTSTASNLASTTGVEREEDGRYVAGSSEDPEDSAAILGKPLTRSIEHFDAGDVDVGSETSTDDDDDENEKNRGPTRRPIIKQDAFLNYDGSSDGLEEGEIYEHPVTAPATSPFTPPTSLTPKHVSAITRAVATSRTPAIQSDPDGETQVFRTPGGTLFKPGTTSPGRINELMGRSRWAS
ncbi:hypothetical protein UCRNP2_3961 [Neofusicoccum parvum UCRNP2]|uniref:Uncharacterized protein n=1 Tax=Botryosphaeria parva (strain UCR-NP2) TaxID=1287680 RepID=R1GT73_BOTPV|nr:hypothetical protein UCRNP2_3961 [Neofusicoccum parvum UCRNP2]